MCAARDPSYFKTRGSQGQSVPRPSSRAGRCGGSGTGGGCAAAGDALEHLSAGTAGLVPPSPPAPARGHGWQGPVSPVLPVLGGQLGPLSNGQRQSRAGGRAKQRGRCEARRARCCLGALSCSSAGAPGLSSIPAAGGPQPHQLGLAPGLTPKRCHLPARDSWMEP